MNTSTFQLQSRQRFPLRLLVATCMLALAAGVAQTASAAPGAGPGPGPYGNPGGPGYGMMAGGMGHGMGHGMMGGGMGRAGGMADGRHIERMLDTVSATPEQRAQIKPIVEAARTELLAQREVGRKLREQQQSLFAQPNIDAGAIEAARQQMLAHHDQASKRMTQLMVDVSKVLTPEQRKALSERMVQRRGMMERHRAERAALGKS